MKRPLSPSNLVSSVLIVTLLSAAQPLSVEAGNRNKRPAVERPVAKGRPVNFTAVERPVGKGRPVNFTAVERPVGKGRPVNVPVNSQRPNVIVIYTDDQGSVDANCYGATDLTTPNLDKLAASGIRFTQMYAPSAICSASRAGLLTGRIPLRAGVPGNVSSQKGVPGMPTSEVTLAEMMRRGGYVTGHVGKWHLGYTPDTMPNGQGFKSSYGHMGGCIDNYSHFFYWNGPNRHDLWENGKEIWADGEFFPNLMVKQCQKFLDANQQKPFFLYWAINVPHYPLQGTQRWRDHYAKKTKMSDRRRKYGAFVSTMDECIGRVVSHVEQLGLRDKTLIIFQSDHGHSTEVRTFGGGGSAGPYRGAKGCLFEGGIRVPSIVSWPAGLPAKQVRGQFATGCDWFPTIAEICKVPLPKRKLDGKSLFSVLKSAQASSPHDGKFYWHLGGGRNAQWAVRDGAWKLLGNPQDRSNLAPLGKQDRLFLVNLNSDLGERNNLAQKNPEIVRRLQAYREAKLNTIDRVPARRRAK